MRAASGDAPHLVSAFPPGAPSETIARLKLPIGVVVEGTKKRAWLRESLDTYADAVVAEVRKGLSEGQAADKGAG